MALRTAETATVESIQRNAEMVMVQAIRIKTLEGMIRGLMDAMKPLLDEWQTLTKEPTEPKE
jgi:hypothetical protein